MSVAKIVKDKLSKLNEIGDHVILNDIPMRRLSPAVSTYAVNSDKVFAVRHVRGNNIVMCFGGK
ncbi:MAG: hypothetical protein RSE18_00970 [Acinetobacter sp.]